MKLLGSQRKRIRPLETLGQGVVRKEMTNGVRYSIQLSPGENEARPKISLGKVTKKQAETAKRNIEKLINCRNTGFERLLI